MTTADLQQWQQGLGARVTLQADLTWAGGQDGYVAAGGADSANPFQALFWVLEPMAEHCDDCLSLAAQSPYDPPWDTSPNANILQTVPGGGATECGAACKCSLEYGGADGVAQNPATWLPNGMPGLPAGGEGEAVQPTPPQPSAAAPASSSQPQSRSAYGPYGPILRGGFTNEQKAALDLYRLAELQWNKVRGQLPELPNFFTLANPNFTWERFDWNTLTKAQQKALQMALEAFYRWSALTPLSPEDLEEMGFAEDADADADAVKLYNNYPRQSGGRYGFGPGIAHGGHEGGGVHASGGMAHGHHEEPGTGHGGGGGGGTRVLAARSEVEARQQEHDEARKTFQKAMNHAAHNRNWSDPSTYPEKQPEVIESEARLREAESRLEAAKQHLVDAVQERGSNVAHAHFSNWRVPAATDHIHAESPHLAKLLDVENEKEEAGETKARIAQDLASHVAGNKSVEELGRAIGSANVEETVSTIVHGWAISSASPHSLAMMHAVEDEFGMRESGRRPGVDLDRLAAGAALYAEHGDAYRAVARAMYENTQEWFARNEITEVSIHRGMRFEYSKQPSDIGWGQHGKGHEGLHEFAMNPVSSFTVSHEVAAETFARSNDALEHGYTHSLILSGRIPVARIFATAQTGYGCKSEGEMLVLGGRMTLRYHAINHVDDEEEG